MLETGSDTESDYRPRVGPPPSRRKSYGAEILRRKSRVVSETMGGYGGVEREDDPGD